MKDTLMPTYIYDALPQGAAVANGLRNPLASIRFQIELLRDQTDELDPRREPIDRALEEIDRVTDAVQAVLDHSELPQPQIQTCDLAKALDEATRSLLAKAERSGVGLRREGFDREIHIETDGALLGKAVRRILTNAVEASSTGGHAEIYCDKSQGQVEINIVDQGCGFQTEELNRAGEAFFTNKSKGLGLGLHLAKRDLELIGAKVEIRSAQDKGTTVTIRIPEKKSKR